MWFLSATSHHLFQPQVLLSIFFIESSAPCRIEIIVKTGLALWVEEAEVCFWGVILGSSGSFSLIVGGILSFKFYICGSRLGLCWGKFGSRRKSTLGLVNYSTMSVSLSDPFWENTLEDIWGHRSSRGFETERHRYEIKIIYLSVFDRIFLERESQSKEAAKAVLDHL